MSQCLEGCKWTCIIGYVMASLGSIVLAYNLLHEEGKRKPFIPPTVLIWAYLVGAIVTLWCSARWAMAAPVKRA